MQHQTSKSNRSVGILKDFAYLAMTFYIYTRNDFDIIIVPLNNLRQLILFCKKKYLENNYILDNTRLLIYSFYTEKRQLSLVVASFKQKRQFTWTFLTVTRSGISMPFTSSIKGTLATVFAMSTSIVVFKLLRIACLMYERS